MTQPFVYPSLTRGEKLADGVMHALGVTFAITGTVLLIVFATGRTDAGTIIGLSIYGAALIVSFIASACYHLTPFEHIRPALRRVDQAAIYLKIAGTYTPFVLLVGTSFAYAVLGLVWALALLGMVVKLTFGTRLGVWAPILYLAMGWLSLLLLGSLFPILPLAGTILIVAGGVIYTIGVSLFYWKKMRFHTAIWHGHVLAASACFFIAISLGAFATQPPF